MLFPYADIRNPGVGIFRQSDSFQQTGSLRTGLVPVNHPALGPFVADEDVLGDGLERTQCEFLMDDHDSVRFGIIDGTVFAFLAVEHDSAAVTAIGIHSGENVHQCRFPGTVLTADGMYLSTFDGKIHIGKGLNRSKRFGDAFHRQNGVSFRHVTTSS